MPSPEQLKLKNETTKIPIALSKGRVDFFKAAAKENDMQYQKVIRQLLDEYVTHHKSTE
ncbi:MAG: putative DNA binding CopG/RHH family protein [Kiritimatiellia bacterium]